MVLTCAEAFRHIDHARAGTGDVPDAMDIINQSGYWFVSCHPWKWLEGRSEQLALRGKITFSDGAWDQTTKTLTSTGAFANYEFLDGDEIDIISAAGALDVTGLPKITAKVDANSITLDRDLGVDDTAVTVEISLNTVRLPADFREEIAISSTNSLINGLKLVGWEQLLSLRTSQIEVTTSWNFYGAVVNVGVPPVPAFEIWPTPTDSDNADGTFTMFYRGGWARCTADEDIISVPEWLEMQYLEVLRAVTLGYEEADNASVGMRLEAVADSRFFKKAYMRDGSTQSTYGPLRGSAVIRDPRGGWDAAALATEVGGPV